MAAISGGSFFGGSGDVSGAMRRFFRGGEPGRQRLFVSVKRALTCSRAACFSFPRRGSLARCLSLLSVVRAGAEAVFFQLRFAEAASLIAGSADAPRPGFAAIIILHNACFFY
jgi:hypothetical protein